VIWTEPGAARELLPGMAVAALVAVAAQFLSEHYGAPAMLMALLLGIALNFLGTEGRTAEGIAFTARTVLRLGVALLGARISVKLLLELGPGMIGLVVAGVAATILFGLVSARFFGYGWRFALLTSGAVAICGASAAMAIAAILPRDERSEQRLTFTVLGVTVLSTFSMILYPVAVAALGLDERAGGVFLGAAIHDVAQVVGAGFSVSEATGETATLVKLIRVTMLAPVVLIAALAIRGAAGERAGGEKGPPLLPGFVLGFLALAAANSLGLVPAGVAAVAEAASRWALLVAIAAVGLKTSLREILAVGGAAIGLLVAETLFLAAFVLLGLRLIG
jgi:uncharacterized integral membrane protein (TIGR00698 family)